jgi:hypothetical protein
MVVFKGRWHSVRKTVVGTLVDKNGKRFEVRFLVDSGATVSIILMQTLFLTKGSWDVGITPPIMMHGINSVSMCDMMLEVKFMPGCHITPQFKSIKNMTDEFGITLQFYVQRGVKAYTCNKQELPSDVLKELSDPKYMLADPYQAAPGDEKLCVHGIIGEDQISLLEECSTHRIGQAGLKLTDSHFGHILHGNSHFMEVNHAEVKPKMSKLDKPPFVISGCGNAISIFGINVELSDENDKQAQFQNDEWVKDITKD